MKKTLLFLILIVFGPCLHRAMATDIDPAENTLYLAPTADLVEGTATITMMLKNQFDVHAYSVDIYLPDALSEATFDIKVSTARKTDGHALHWARQADGAYRVIWYASDDVPFTAGDGAVATITLQGVAAGHYNIRLEKIDLSDGYNDLVSGHATSSTVGVAPPTYDANCSLQVLPFLITESMGEAETPVLLTTDKALTKVEYDLILPESLVTNEACWHTLALSSAKYKITEEVTDGVVHVVVERKNTYTIAAGEAVTMVRLGMLYDDLIGQGPQAVVIKNIKLTDTEGHTIHVAPYTTYFIQDVYQRSMANKWGTICLPYATQSGADVQLYSLSGVNETEGYLSLSPVATLAANTPGLFRTESVTAIFPVVTAGEAEATEMRVPTSVTDWTIAATYFDRTLDPASATLSSADIYYLAGDLMWHGNEAFNIKSFRAWFEVPAGAVSPVSRLRLAAAEGTHTGLDVVEQEDGTVKVYYDLQGRETSQPERGIYITNSKKIYKK